MVLFNYSTRELTAKIVYYGPGLCGKTTNLQYIYNSLPESVRKGKMLSLATKTDRTLFFDFLPIELGTIRGMRTRVQLYTVPGQVFYNSTRKLVLKGADGVVFVADSQSKMIEANIESYRNLEENLREMGIRLEEIPVVMQFNKRDLQSLASIEEMNTRINRHNAPFYEAVAMTGIGVEDTLKAITKLVLNNLSAKYRIEEGTGAHRAAPEPPAGATVAVAASPPPAAARRRAPPEDLALDALDAGNAMLQAVSRPPAAAAAPAPPQPADDVIELVDEVEDAPPAVAPPSLAPPAMVPHAVAPPPARPHQEARREAPAPARAPAPAPVTMHPAALRSAPPRPAAAARASTQSPAAALDDDLLDENDPIDLDDPLAIAGDTPPVAGPLAIGPLAPGEEQEIELPVRVELGGRTLQIQVRLKVRLTG
jgi:signal recognition particle receptor subunit beta